MIELIEAWLYRPNFIAFVILFLWGLYITVVHHNLVKKLIGLYLVQTSVIFFSRHHQRQIRSDRPGLDFCHESRWSGDVRESLASRSYVDCDCGSSRDVGCLPGLGVGYLSKVRLTA